MCELFCYLVVVQLKDLFRSLTSVQAAMLQCANALYTSCIKNITYITYGVS